METVRETWTDERLDDLNHRVDVGFREVGEEFRALRLEMRTEFGGMIAVLLVGFLGVIATILTQV